VAASLFAERNRALLLVVVAEAEAEAAGAEEAEAAVLQEERRNPIVPARKQGPSEGTQSKTSVLLQLPCYVHSVYLSVTLSNHILDVMLRHLHTHLYVIPYGRLKSCKYRAAP
jgi:hypothetical protein